MRRAIIVEGLTPGRYKRAQRLGWRRFIEQTDVDVAVGAGIAPRCAAEQIGSR